LLHIDTWTLIQEAYTHAGDLTQHFSKVGLVGHKFFRWFITTSIGGTLLGLLCGALSSLLYRRFCRRHSARIKDKSPAQEDRAPSNPPPP
ncbi:MAG: hypothetical protein LBF21_00825, partial [Puniceicoccales bacterium]|nr:hypothetical protein [Puniceicoccales bacterium]